MKFPTLIFSLLLFIFSCSLTNKNSRQANEKISNNILDTNKAIAELNIREKLAELDSINEKISLLSEHIDTLELTYYFGFCDCQRWVISSIHDQALLKHTDLDELDPRGQIEFNLDKHGYYIEPASKELELNWRIQINGTKVRFIGREYLSKGLPKDEKFTVPNPPPGKVFRYYSYEIIRPYKIWGPEVFLEIDKESGDSLKETSIILVK